jgi:hypothetical protein
MTDPERLLSGAMMDDDAELEVRLLASIRDVSAPPSAKAQAWETIARNIGAATASIGAAAGAAAIVRSLSQAPAPLAPVIKTAATGIFSSLGVKVAVGVAVTSAALGVGGNWVMHHAETSTARSVVDPAAKAPMTTKTATAVVATPTSAAAGVDVAPAGTTEAEAQPTAASPDALGVETRALRRAQPENTLDAESALLTEARGRLRSGKPRAALAELRQLDQRFPRGALRQEREVLAIEALSAIGDDASARRRAHAFLKAYPASPHAPVLRRLAVDP